MLFFVLYCFLFAVSTNLLTNSLTFIYLFLQLMSPAKIVFTWFLLTFLSHQLIMTVIKGSSWHIKCTVSGLVHFCIWIFMRQNGRQFHESVARRKLKWQDFYYNSRISSDMQYCNKSLFYTPKTGYKMPSLQGFHFYNNINIMQVFLSI